jgi:ATP-dependent Lhr-like helicase
LSPRGLRNRVLALSPFREIDENDFLTMIRHLVEIGHMQLSEDRGLMIGLEGEKIIGSFRFLAVFKDYQMYSVRHESVEIGIFNYIPPVGDRILLTGRAWEVIDYHIAGRKIFVKPVKGMADTGMLPGMADIHTKILVRMRQVLQEDKIYGYLQDGARKRLAEARDLYGNAQIGDLNVFRLKDGRICILPWVGSKTFRAVRLFLRHMGDGMAVKKGIHGPRPYYITFRPENGDPQRILDAFQRLCASGPEILDMAEDKEIPAMQKFDEFIPAGILKKYYLLDFLNGEELRNVAENWSCGEIAFP